MANMSYCRFVNTYQDLKDCYDHWDDADSGSEKRYRERLLELCKDILEDCSDYTVDIQS